jgi:3,5-epimerase/4-reductase
MKISLSKVLFVLFILQYGETKSKNFLVFGGRTGYLGQKIMQTIKSMGHVAISGQSRLENRQDLINEIQTIMPDYIINAAGITGKSNLDWCETHRPETIRVNIIGTLNLIDVAYMYNIHVTNISTASLYKYDEAHQMYGGNGFTEEDEPNFDKVFYSRMKIYLEKIMLEYPNLLNLRITMPVAADFHIKNFLIKITTYKKVMTVPITLTVLEDLWPVAIDMTLKERKGNYNFVNPGTICHNEILDLYKLYIDPTFEYQIFSVPEQIKILNSGRSNSELSTKKLLAEYPNIHHIKDSLITIFKKMKEIKDRENK